jgi:fructose-bisphosphate aldolase class II
LVSGSELLRKARTEGYAVGAFSVHTAEMVQGVLEAAEEEKSPVLLQIGQRAIRYTGFATLVNYIHHFGRKVSVPVAIHLDHGNSFEQAIQAIRHGCTSVMYDGSHTPLQHNIEVTRQVVKAARAAGVSVEGELGKIAGVEDDLSVSEEEAFLTDPSEALEFVEQTGVDSLAVAIGSAHGLYKKTPKLDFDRIEEIYRLTQIPLVLHGGSGIPDEQIRRAVSLGIAKINVDTELRAAFSLGLREAVESGLDGYDPYAYLRDAASRMKEIVRTKIRIFGSSNRA